MKNKTINETTIRKTVPKKMCQKSLILFNSLIREFRNIETNKMKNYQHEQDLSLKIGISMEIY